MDTLVRVQRNNFSRDMENKKAAGKMKMSVMRTMRLMMRQTRKNQTEPVETTNLMRNGKKSETKWLNLEKLAITVMKRPVQN